MIVVGVALAVLSLATYWVAQAVIYRRALRNYRRSLAEYRRVQRAREEQGDGSSGRNL